LLFFVWGPKVKTKRNNNNNNKPAFTEINVISHVPIIFKFACLKIISVSHTHYIYIYLYILRIVDVIYVFGFTDNYFVRFDDVVSGLESNAIVDLFTARIIWFLNIATEHGWIAVQTAVIENNSAKLINNIIPTILRQ